MRITRRVRRASMGAPCKRRLFDVDRSFLAFARAARFSHGCANQPGQVSFGDLRRTRYRGLVKTRLLHLLIATALNVVRVAAWLAEQARAQSRITAFARL